MYFFPGQGSPGSLPSSVEYSQLPSNMTSQTYPGTYRTQSELETLFYAIKVQLNLKNDDSLEGCPILSI